MRMALLWLLVSLVPLSADEIVLREAVQVKMPDGEVTLPKGRIFPQATVESRGAKVVVAGQTVFIPRGQFEVIDSLAREKRAADAVKIDPRLLPVPEEEGRKFGRQDARSHREARNLSPAELTEWLHGTSLRRFAAWWETLNPKVETKLRPDYPAIMRTWVLAYRDAFRANLSENR